MGFLRPLVIIIIIFLTLTPLYAGDTPEGEAIHYSIQTATYSLTAQRYARRHYDFIKKEFAQKNALPVRLLKGNKYLVIRLGWFKEFKEAKEVLAKVKTLISDAFVLKIKQNEGLEVVASYVKNERTQKEAKKKSSEGKTEKVKEEKTKKDVKEATLKKEIPRVIYTIEVGTYSRLKEAINELKAISEQLGKEMLDSLRIERHGMNYSLRIGIFNTYKDAEEFLASRASLKGVVVQSRYSKEKVVFSYADTRVGEGVEDAEGLRRQEEEIELFISDVEERLENEDFGEAARLLREAVKRWPENPEIHALYGETLLNMGFAKSAYRQYKKAIELSPDVSEYHSGLGYSLLNIYIQRAQESIEAFQKALEIDPDNVDALEGLGTVYVSIDRKDLAEEIYRRLLELDPVAAKGLRDLIDSGLDITGTPQ